MAQNKATETRAKEAELITVSLAARAREEHEKSEALLLAERERSNAELDRVRDELRAAQARVDSLSARECRKQSAVALNHLERGAELATRCSQELSEQHQALKTCVRMYQDLQSVYGNHQ